MKISSYLIYDVNIVSEMMSQGCCLRRSGLARGMERCLEIILRPGAWITNKIVC